MGVVKGQTEMSFITQEKKNEKATEEIQPPVQHRKDLNRRKEKRRLEQGERPKMK